MSIFRALVDLVFPPLCSHCNSYTKLNYLCETCWKESALLDPFGRCLHCFAELEEDGTLCATCKQQPQLPFQRAALFDHRSPIFTLMNDDVATAIAGFAYYQWLRLDWEEPDLIVAVSPHRKESTRMFAELCAKPSPHLFRRIAWPLNQQRWEVEEELIEEGATILLFDEGCSSRQLQMAAAALSTAFPKKVYLLSLFL